MRLHRPILKIILLISITAWLAACGGGGSSAITLWGMAELVDDVGNVFDPQIISSPAYL